MINKRIKLKLKINRKEKLNYIDFDEKQEKKNTTKKNNAIQRFRSCFVFLICLFGLLLLFFFTEKHTFSRMEQNKEGIQRKKKSKK